MIKAFLEDDEIISLGCRKDGEEPTEKGGIDILSDGKNRIIATGEENVMVVGPTGSGKTRSFSLPLLNTLIDSGESFVSVDAKSTSFESTSAHAKSAGFKTYVLNLREPSRSDKWGLLEPYYMRYFSGSPLEKDNVVRELDMIAECIFHPDGQKEDFWNYSAQSLFTGATLAMFQLIDEPEQATLSNLMQVLNEAERRVGAYSCLRGISDEMLTDEVTKNYLATYIYAASETRGGILPTLKTKTKMFNSISVQSVLCGASTFDINKLEDTGKTAIYIILPEETLSLHPIGSLMIKMLYQRFVSISEKNNGCLKNRLNFVMEEFGNLCIPAIDLMLSACRSRNIRMHLFLQTLEQLSFRYSREQAVTIKENCCIQMYFQSNNLSTLIELSNLSGTRTDGIPVLSLHTLRTLPKHYVLVKIHGQQYVRDFPDLEDYHFKNYGVASYPQNDLNESLPKFHIYDVYTEFKKKQMQEAMQKTSNSLFNVIQDPPSAFTPEEIEKMVADIDSRIAEIKKEEEEAEEMEETDDES